MLCTPDKTCEKIIAPSSRILKTVPHKYKLCFWLWDWGWMVGGTLYDVYSGGVTIWEITIWQIDVMPCN